MDIVPFTKSKKKKIKSSFEPCAHFISALRRKLCSGRQPIVNWVVAQKATDWCKFGKRCETGNSIGLYSVSECIRKLLMEPHPPIILSNVSLISFISVRFSSIQNVSKWFNIWSLPPNCLYFISAIQNVMEAKQIYFYWVIE